MSFLNRIMLGGTKDYISRSSCFAIAGFNVGAGRCPSSFGAVYSVMGVDHCPDKLCSEEVTNDSTGAVGPCAYAEVAGSYGGTVGDICRPNADAKRGFM